MKTTALVILSLLVMAILNFQVFQKEQVLRKGKTVLLRLAPVDPRSLMQGDYMRLNYAMTREVGEPSLGSSGHLVVSLDQHQVARFVRIHQKEPLQPGEHLLRYRNRGGLRIGAESFFFQEGHADLYAKAAYGQLKVDAGGNSVLVGLCGEDFLPLGKSTNQVE